MILTLTIEQEGQMPFDIQVPSQQRMEDTLNVLFENKLISSADKRGMKLYSFRNQSQLDIEKSYEENVVYTSDIIKIQRKSGELL